MRVVERCFGAEPGELGGDPVSPRGLDELAGDDVRREVTGGERFDGVAGGEGGALGVGGLVPFDELGETFDVVGGHTASIRVSATTPAHVAWFQ